MMLPQNRIHKEVRAENIYHNLYSDDELVKLIMDVYVCHRSKINPLNACSKTNPRECAKCKLKDLKSFLEREE